MTDQVVLTFAELEFLLRTGVPAADLVRERLRLRSSADSEALVAAGVASLLARGLCTQDGADVRPGEVVLGVVAALSTTHTVTDATGQVDGRPVVVDLFTGDVVRVAFVPGFFGQFGVELVDAAEPLSGPLERFVELATAGTGEAAVVIRSVTATGDGRVSLAVARDAAGQWYESDSFDSPDRGRPASRAAVTARLRELFGAAPVGAGTR